MATRVVHLSTVHARKDTRIFLKECRTLAEAGFDTSLVVADGGSDEVKDGVKIFGLPCARGRLGRMHGSVRRVLAKALELDADVYHLHDPELLQIALRLMRNGKRVIFDSHEDLPRQILGKHWVPYPLRHSAAWLSERIEDYLAPRLSGVVAATPHIAERFRRLIGNTVNINNYPLLDELAPPAATARKRRMQVCYVGGITRIRGLKPVIEALPMLPGVRLLLCGTFGESDFEKELRAMPGWQQVDYRGQVDRVAMQSILGESMAGLVTFLPFPNHTDAQPNKMFEYMSAELPVIASDFPLWRQIVGGAQAGVCVDPRSPDAIAAAIRRLAADPHEVERMGRAGREAVLERFNWPNEAAKLVKFYEKLQ
ncbi:MAG: glycosyltransferase [Proteobacteria bacterium]|nr:glycosyltransferase [Pseudomonadota bacterium]